MTNSSHVSFQTSVVTGKETDTYVGTPGIRNYFLFVDIYNCFAID